MKTVGYRRVLILRGSATPIRPTWGGEVVDDKKKHSEKTEILVGLIADLACQTITVFFLPF